MRNVKQQVDPKFRLGDHIASKQTVVPDLPLLTIESRSSFRLSHLVGRIDSILFLMFTPIHTSLGALLLFQGSSGLLFHNGAVFGISSLLSGCIINPSSDNIPIIAGIVCSVAPVYLFAPSLIPSYPAAPSSLAAVASTVGTGFLLGWGTKVWNRYFNGGRPLT